jgi:hypothetical protein
MSDNGLYTCQARSSSGQAVWSASLSVADPNDAAGVQFKAMPYFSQFPASPSMPVFVNATSTSITVAWDKPHRIGGSPLKGYQVIQIPIKLFPTIYEINIIKSTSRNISSFPERSCQIYLFHVIYHFCFNFVSVGLLHTCHAFTLAHHSRGQTGGLHSEQTTTTHNHRGKYQQKILIITI